MTEVNPRAVGQTRSSYDAVPESAGDARQALRDHAINHGAAAEIQDAIAPCVTEAVTNAVVHAYRDRPQPGQVQLEASRLDDALCVCVRDQGSRTHSPLRQPRTRLGMPLMASLAAAFEVRTASGGGTEIRLRFSLAG